MAKTTTPAKKVTKAAEKISKYFTEAEFTRSRTAEAAGIKNFPNAGQKESIKWVANNVADPIREATGGALFIRSGFRSAKVNKAVGGVETSYHQFDRKEWAFDCVSAVQSLNDLVKTIRELKLPSVTKVILEVDEGVVHVQGIIPEYLARDIIEGEKVYVNFDSYLKAGKVTA